ncbi:MAG: inorganic diphosphatase [Oscillospiraceae bacterium]|jgi:inorganic pyrophosphatase|nr:inorganic diphosphatase [Oscillospiraceae bacterium]
MNIWHDIGENRVNEEDFVCVIEISKGGKSKYELDKQTGMLELDRVLHASMVYPANYGFIPRTYGGDKDPLDVFVICSEPILPMTLVRCYPVGVLYMVDGGEMDEKIVAIPFKDPHNNWIADTTDLPKFLCKEIEHFFACYKDLEGKKTEIKEFLGRNQAREVIKQALEGYKKAFC